MMITGSNAAGEAIPPHFQFMTSAQSEDTMQMRMDMAEYFPDILCNFGRETAQPTAISYGMNEKGGMDEIEFKKYIKNSILHLYPDACDVPGKRVIIKVNSGPGRLNIELLAELRLMGFTSTQVFQIQRRSPKRHIAITGHSSLDSGEILEILLMHGSSRIRASRCNHG